MATANPFTLTYDALWALVEASPLFIATVKEKNRIKFNGSAGNPKKNTVQPADLPEVMLVTDGTAQANLHASSCHTMVVRRYAFIVSTGDFRMHDFLNQVEWALFCALCRWKEVLAALQYNGQGFVKKCDLTEVSEGESDSERNRNIKGWSTIWRCEVTMYFPTANLITEATPV